MIYVIVGPTGSGKTDAANAIASALKCPIINGDAFQIYKDMNIGTNKISISDPMYSSYYMLDVVSPNEAYSVKRYQEDARKVLNNLLKENNNVVIVGGTGLYIKALLYDYEFNDEEDGIDDDLVKLDNKQLHLLLESMDKDESIKIHENNRKRLLRAIMLIRNNSKTKTEMLANQEHKMIYDSSIVNVLYLCPSRESLYEKINERVINMIDNGLVDEVKELQDKYSLSITATQGIGYKEVTQYLNNEIDLKECVELIQKRTRNYAKRQDTFFNHQFDNVKKFSSKEELIKFVIN